MKEMVSDVSSFKVIFRDLIILGIPLPWDGNGYIHSKQTYAELLELKINKYKCFDRITRVFIGKDIMELLAPEFKILHQLKGVFMHLPQPSYKTYSNLDEIVPNMNKIDYLMGKSWNYMYQLLKIPTSRQSGQVVLDASNIKTSKENLCHNFF
jgi:hypothetical protein